MAATNGSIFASSTKPIQTTLSIFSSRASPSSNTLGSNFKGSSLPKCPLKWKKVVKDNGKVFAAATAVATTPAEEVKEFTLPSWAMFELGRAPVYWKTMNGLPPTAGEKLRIFYNPAAKNLVPNEEYGIAFNASLFPLHFTYDHEPREIGNSAQINDVESVLAYAAFLGCGAPKVSHGGFNQPIMCGGKPRAMLKKRRGKADSPIYSIQICIPKHALNLIFSFTNGDEWDGPYRLQFQVPKAFKNKPIEFFNEGLAEELSKDGACERVIFPDTSIVINRCTIMGNLTVEGGDRCNLNLVLGCTDPSSPLYDPNANVDDGSCPID